MEARVSAMEVALPATVKTTSMAATVKTHRL
jgi:hypothetical protein